MAKIPSNPGNGGAGFPGDTYSRPPISGKNLGLAASLMNVGQGDLLKQQVEDETDARKKKLLAQSSGITRDLGSSLMGPTATQLLASRG